MNRIIFFSITFIILIGITIFLDFQDSNFSSHDILVEFHGLIFDLFFLGIILAIYESYSSKTEKIERYNEEIDDLRRWESEEAKFKNLGNIRRLYDLGVKKMNLNHCYLRNGDLKEYDFTESTFVFSNLEEASFSRSNLTKCILSSVNLKKGFFVESIAYKTNFEYSDLSNATLTRCDFSFSNLRKVNLNGAKICATDFNCADMSFADLENVKVYDMNWLENLKLNEVKGMEKFEIIPSYFDIDEIGEYWIVTKKPAHNNGSYENTSSVL